MGDLGNMHTKRIWKIWSFMEERNKINNSTFVPTSESSFFFTSIPRIHCDSLNVITYLLTDPWHFERVSLTFSTSHDTKATIERRSINKDRLSYGRSFIFPLLESLFHPTKRIRNVTTRNVPIATSFVENKKKRKRRKEISGRKRERKRIATHCRQESTSFQRMVDVPSLVICAHAV